MTIRTSIGKLRGLQQCALPNGTFAILALDHRNNLRIALNPRDPQGVSDQRLITIKREITAALATKSSAVLLDPEFGAAQCIGSQSLPGNVGLIVALEATGYGGSPEARKSQVLTNWSVAKAKRMGASAVKLLVYYHPGSPKAAEIESLIERVAAQCRVQDLPLFLEPLSYSLDLTRKKLLPEERRQVVIESARRLTRLGIDILKAEFPLDVSVEEDERVWAEACAALSAASQVPWVLLSATTEYRTFLHQVAVACRSGASGVAVGRAAWQEAVELDEEKRSGFLTKIACERMRKITRLCRSSGQPFSEFYSAGNIPPDWYVGYQGG